MPEKIQAKLFIDINHEQKSVPRGLLYELYSGLKRDAEEEKDRVESIVSSVLQALNEEPESPFHRRFQLTHHHKSDQRCIRLATVAAELKKPGMFIIKENVAYGPLWSGSYEATVERTKFIVNGWFREIIENVRDWWVLGAAEGGGFAMTDGVVVCIGLLKSVFQHLSGTGLVLVQLTEKELLQVIRPFAIIVSEYLGNLSSEDRTNFRKYSRGIGGQTGRRRQLEKVIRDVQTDFNPPGLEKELEYQAAETNKTGYAIIHQIEPKLKQVVLSGLLQEFGDEGQWWFNAVPQKIRKKIDERYDQEKGKGEKEDYFDLIDYRDIIVKNWPIFKDKLGYGPRGDKHIKTEWIASINELRKVVMHPGKNRYISHDELNQLRDYNDWLANVSF